MKLLWLPDHLREWGLEPIEVDGWRTRGYGSFDTFKPSGFVDHHTAGGQGWAPSLGIVIHGRGKPGATGYLPGPLAQLFTPRNPQGRRQVHVVAAGRANHAGKGGWLNMAGNSSVVGHERENVGTKAEPWQPWQTEDAAIVAACVLDGLGRYEHVTTNAGRYCEHKEWAPTRKSDAHTVIGDDMRRRVRAAQPGPTPTEPSEEDDMHLISVDTRVWLVGGNEPVYVGNPKDLGVLIDKLGAVTTAKVFLVSHPDGRVFLVGGPEPRYIGSPTELGQLIAKYGAVVDLTDELATALTATG